MWIHSKIGFFSAVADYDRAGFLLVRARFEEDIRALCALVKEIDGEEPVPKKTPARDYLWRISIGNVTWGRVLARLAEGIEYTNFKGAVHGDPIRDRAYLRCWTAMRDAQDEAQLRPGPRRRLPPGHGG